MALSKRSDEEALVSKEGDVADEVLTGGESSLVSHQNGLESHQNSLGGQQPDPISNDQRTYFDERIEIPGAQLFRAKIFILFEFIEKRTPIQVFD